MFVPSILFSFSSLSLNTDTSLFLSLCFPRSFFVASVLAQGLGADVREANDFKDKTDPLCVVDALQS